MTLKKALLTLALAAAGMAQAAPLTYNFSYTAAGGDVVAGQLVGTLQGDNNTIAISSLLDFATFNGSPQLSLPFVNSFLANLAAMTGQAVTSLDGSVQDFIFCESAACNEGFGIAPPGAFGPAPNFNSSNSFGNHFEDYVGDRWRISAAVPEPTSMVLVGLALLAAGVGASRRRPARTQA